MLGASLRMKIKLECPPPWGFIQVLLYIVFMQEYIFRHNGQRDYKCGVCDFYGYTFTDIRKHIERKHTDAKALICDKCGSAFKTDWHLRVS